MATETAGRAVAWRRGASGRRKGERPGQVGRSWADPGEREGEEEKEGVGLWPCSWFFQILVFSLFKQKLRKEEKGKSKIDLGFCFLPKIIS